MKTRTFLITGASKGIGRALSDMLAAQGHRVVGVARNANDPTFPGELVAIDLSDRAATDAGLEALVARHDFDGVVNNVALVRPQRIGDVDLDELDLTLRVNLHPTVQAVQALLPGMRERGWGRIINISSLTILGMVERTAYAAAKSAMVSFTRSWGLELARTGITVNSVAPGPTETVLFRENNPPGSEGEKRYLASVPMNRFGKPEEIAATIAFLLGDEASFMTGQTLFVDGGASIGKLPF
ncbi:SDR family oxidoreductase [Luteibacter aegosomatissinici]|jgi:3-oxoacyl-[acyl-carrier protein] reductase|uniref:SDR family oxidoreductase n=1 Tax=Luteibacter aegosomatissinici TaxID=2911539 RepID=UPI001FF8CD07|nr:SDR family oxidoreductase [Luteibacter aegosomatissinici]UPG94337.1 SDR family oxidoreductase [Luteibacter aegosomatissinici]